MKRLTELVSRFAEVAQGLGGLGLVLMAFLDSSFVPLPGAVDGSILLLAAYHPDRWYYYSLMAMAGSVGGCYALYSVARKGGEEFLKKRVHERHATRGLEIFRRHGLLAIVVPSLLPPPMPFKLFVLLAGVTGVRRRSFILAVAIGRGFRYGAMGLLAKWYGLDAGRFVSAHLSKISIWLAVAIAVGGLLFVLWRRRRAS